MSHSLYRLFEAVERQGPGSVEDTQRAWAAIDAPLHPRIAEMGSGSGAAARVLLRGSAGSVTALDRHAPFLEQLERWARQRGVADRLTTVVGDMAAPPWPDGSFDVVWSEAAAYAVGFEKALRAWRRLLCPGGHLAVSELVWRSEDAPEEARAFFTNEYPDMTTADERRALALACGYRLVEDFMISKAGWWDHYYVPLLAEAARLESETPDDAMLLEVIDAVRVEARIYREHGDHYGYLFLVLQKRS